LSGVNNLLGEVVHDTPFTLPGNNETQPRRPLLRWRPRSRFSRCLPPA
jgi:hypothetical protein